MEFDADEIQQQATIVSKSSGLINCCEDGIKLQEQLQSATSTANLDVNGIENCFNEATRLKSKCENASVMLERARQLWKDHKNCEKQLSLIQFELDNCNSQFEELKKTLGVCPLCGGKLE